MNSINWEGENHEITNEDDLPEVWTTIYMDGDPDLYELIGDFGDYLLAKVNGSTRNDLDFFIDITDFSGRRFILHSLKIAGIIVITKKQQLDLWKREKAWKELKNSIMGWMEEY